MCHKVFLFFFSPPTPPPSFSNHRGGERRLSKQEQSARYGLEAADLPSTKLKKIPDALKLLLAGSKGRKAPTETPSLLSPSSRALFTQCLLQCEGTAESSRAASVQDFLIFCQAKRDFAIGLDYSLHATFSQGLAREVRQVSDEDTEPGCRSFELSSQFSHWSWPVPNQCPDTFIWYLAKVQTSRKDSGQTPLLPSQGTHLFLRGDYLSSGWLRNEQTNTHGKIPFTCGHKNRSGSVKSLNREL